MDGRKRTRIYVISQIVGGLFVFIVWLIGGLLSIKDITIFVVGFIIGVGIMIAGKIVFSMSSKKGVSIKAKQQCNTEQMIVQQQFMQQQQQLIQQQFMDQQQQAAQKAMIDEIKSVTPFEMGGVDMTQGNSFNNPPSGMY